MAERANGPLMARKIGNEEAQDLGLCLHLGFRSGAADENRTRVISLED